MRRAALLWLPFALAIGLIGLVAGGLWRPTDRLVHSAMVGRKLPPFAIAPMLPGRAGLSDAAYRTGGRPRLVNVFGSWCLPCAAEAPQLARLRAMGVPIDGVAIRDTPADVAAFLRAHGDPFERLGDDRASRFQLLLGSSGVPETFVISGDGTILDQHIGDIRADDVPELARLAGVR